MDIGLPPNHDYLVKNSIEQNPRLVVYPYYLKQKLKMWNYCTNLIPKASYLQ